MEFISDSTAQFSTARVAIKFGMMVGEKDSVIMQIQDINEVALVARLNKHSVVVDNQGQHIPLIKIATYFDAELIINRHGEQLLYGDGLEVRV